MTVIFKEFPEINRKVGFQANYAPVDGVYLGCHCSSISGISISFGGRYCEPSKGPRMIQVLDTKLEPELTYTYDRYYEVWVPPTDEVARIVEYLNKTDFKMADLGAYPALIERCGTIPLWVMSDVMNYNAPARKPPASGVDGQAIIWGRTRDFVKYLIENKIGYVLSSPIVQNPLHRSNGNYSLNQAWFWIHPNHLERAIDVAEVMGEDKFPSKETWIKIVGADIGVQDPDRVLSRVLETGVFPEDIRFKRQGQTVAKEA